MLICDNQDSNMRDILGPRFLVQRGCTYDKVEYHTAILPGCPIEANPVFTYPVALSCHCSACRTDTDECAHRASMDGTKCTKPVRRIYPYPGHSNYVIPFWLACSCSHNKNTVLVVEVHDINILRKDKRHHILSDLYRLYLSQLYQLLKFCLC